MKPSLHSLTGIRAIAALWVLFFHSRLRNEPAVPEFIRKVIALGDAAVCFFFVLSGFIMVYAYLEKARQATDRKTFNRQYWLNRIARIYPVYLAGFLLAAISTYLVAQTTFYDNPALEIQSWILRILGLHAWWPPLYFEGPNDPSWSLSVEFLFYALFPALIPWIANLSQKKLYPWAAAMCGLSLVGPVILLIIGDAGLKTSTDLGSLISFNPVFRLPNSFSECSADASSKKIYSQTG